MPPKENGNDYHVDGGFNGLRSSHIIPTIATPARRSRQGPVTRQISLTEQMRLACVKGDLFAVQNLIEGKKLSANALLEEGWSALMIAASAARPAVLDYLLLQNADPNLLRKDNFSALMAASGSVQNRTGDVLLCITLLVKSGAKVNAQDNKGVTPLGYAVKENNYKVAKYLVDVGANVNMLDANGKHCLFYAAEKGYGQVARLLLENGADVNTVDKSGWMVGELAVQKGYFKLGELLFRVRESNWRPGKSPALMRLFNQVPKPVETEEPGLQMGSGIVNILTNIQTQVKSLSNLINSVRLRMFQDTATKEYEVESGKLGEIVQFAKRMGQSCTYLASQVMSLNTLLAGDKQLTGSEAGREITENRNCRLLPPPRQRNKSGSPKPKEIAELKLTTGEEIRCKTEVDEIPNLKWNIFCAGATVSVLLVCCATPQLRNKLGGMKLWRI